MIKHIRVLKMVKYKAKRVIYISEQEQLDLIDALTPTEFKLYTTLIFSLSKNWSPADYQYDAIARRMRCSTKTIQNTYYSLRKKGYVELAFFKDEQKEQCVKVVIGKDMVELYKLGVSASITDSQHLQEAMAMYPLDRANMSQEEINEAVERINQHIMNHQ